MIPLTLLHTYSERGIGLRFKDTGEVVEALNNNGAPDTKIGKILPKEHGRKIKRCNEVPELPVCDSDGVTKIFG